MSLNSHHHRGLTENMHPCNFKGCNNYYNISYKSANGFCMKHQKRQWCEICDDMDGKRRKDGIYVCDKCNKEHPIPREE